MLTIVNTLMQKASNIAYLLIQMIMDLLIFKSINKGFRNIAECYKKKVNEHTVDFVTRSKRVK